MTYTNHTAGMTLATARDMLARISEGWTADQLARARAVVSHWERIRRTQAKRAKASEPGHADIMDGHRRAACAMQSGGSFAASIGAAYIAADSHNAPRLVEAFPELFARFAN